jgi:hypothetical protein
VLNSLFLYLLSESSMKACAPVRHYVSFAEIHYKDMLEETLKDDLIISDITGINRVSSRFADKLLFVLSKYQQNEGRRLILRCVDLMVDHASKRKLFQVNNQRFLSIINQLRNNNSALEGYDETPHDTANNIVALGGWQFKISKTIYPLATINEILDGWNELIDDGIPVDLLFLTLFVRTILDDTCNTEALEEEPELVELVSSNLD